VFFHGEKVYAQAVFFQALEKLFLKFEIANSNSRVELF
jgi:hypothetical protein